MALLDLLEQYRGWTLDAGGRMWSVDEYLRDYVAHAPPGERGPEVTGMPDIDAGALTIMRLDAAGFPAERIGLLFQPGRRW